MGKCFSGCTAPRWIARVSSRLIRLDGHEWSGRIDFSNLVQEKLPRQTNERRRRSPSCKRRDREMVANHQGGWDQGRVKQAREQ